MTATDNQEPNSALKKAEDSNLKKAEGIAETLKRLVGIIALVFEAATAYDPTFWGLLWLNPDIADEVFPFAVFASIVVAVVVVIIKREELKKAPEERTIRLKWNLFGLILSSIGLIVLLNLTVSYQANHPPPTLSSAFWRRHLLHGEYVLFVTLTVLFITRIALRVYPQRKKTNTVSNQPQQNANKDPAVPASQSASVDDVSMK